MLQEYNIEAQLLNYTKGILFKPCVSAETQTNICREQRYSMALNLMFGGGWELFAF